MQSARTRYVGFMAMLVLLFSIALPPFVGSATLLQAVQPSATALLQAVTLSEYPSLPVVSECIGFLLLMIGLLVGLVTFGFRYRTRRARFGILLSTLGLLVLSVTLFDYSGDFVSRIFKVVQVGAWPSLEFFGLGYFLAWVAIVIAAVTTRRSAAPPRLMPTITVARAQQQQILEHVVPTGYKALDDLLYGGLPRGSSIVLTGPPCDEKNLILRRFIETNLRSNRACVLISTTLDRVQDLLPRYERTLSVILCNPQADTIAAAFPNVAKLKTLDSLTQLNLEYENVNARLTNTQSAVLCLEVLDDVMLAHHGATRTWLMSILGRTKTNQITCLGTLNPAMHPAEESQAVLETFDGHLDLYEAEVHVRPKIIRVKKMGAGRYSDTEMRVEREKI